MKRVIDVTSLSIWKVIQQFLNDFNLLLTDRQPVSILVASFRHSRVSVKRKLPVRKIVCCFRDGTNFADGSLAYEKNGDGKIASPMEYAHRA